MINLDTHILVYALAGTPTSNEKRLLSQNPWSISAIVLWELSKLVQIGRLDLDLDGPAFRRALAAIQVWPLDFAVCQTSTNLDFHSDPADELIAATSIVHGVPLLTRDKRILGSRKVPFAK